MAAKKKTNSSQSDKVWYSIALLRISLGLIFLWAFFDKLFGLGFATCRDAKTDVVTTMCSNAWVEGGSPAEGFLKFATKGPLQDFYSGLAGNTFIDFLFMAGLLLIGVALIFGVAIKIAAVSGSILMLMMWSAALLPENNPLLDDHIVYIFALMAILYGNDNQKLGLGSRWAKQELVKRFPILS
jgi:thiosulfate dehydrogenase [quinone] large subunit